MLETIASLIFAVFVLLLILSVLLGPSIVVIHTLYKGDTFFDKLKDCMKRNF